MLVVTRRIEQTVRIGDDIEIKIIEIRGNEIRVGINAPRDVKIVRGELAYREV